MANPIENFVHTLWLINTHHHRIIHAPYHHKKKNQLCFNTHFQTMCPTSGLPDVCVTSRVAKTARTWSPWAPSAGSGLQAAQRSLPPTACPLPSATTPGHRLATRRLPSPTMLSSTSTRPMSLACLSSTTCTTTASTGMTLPATTRSPSSARTLTSCWATSPPPTGASASSPLAKDSRRVISLI